MPKMRPLSACTVPSHFAPPPRPLILVVSARGASVLQVVVSYIRSTQATQRQRMCGATFSHIQNQKCEYSFVKFRLISQTEKKKPNQCKDFTSGARTELEKRTTHYEGVVARFF